MSDHNASTLHVLFAKRLAERRGIVGKRSAPISREPKPLQGGG